MPDIKKIANSTVDHVAKHKVAYAVTATALVAFSLHRSVVKGWYEFMEEKGINPMEYYCPEAYFEMHP